MNNSSKQQCVETITKMFRREGYNALSIAKIAKGVGLQKGSLYHYFPGGKKEMAECVLKSCIEEFGSVAISHLYNQSLAPQKRIAKMLEGYDTYTNSGKEPCVITTSSIGESGELFAAYFKENGDAWVNGMVFCLKDAGYSKAKAAWRAKEMIAQIIGTLMLTNITQDYEFYHKMMKTLKTMIIED